MLWQLLLYSNSTRPVIALRRKLKCYGNYSCYQMVSPSDVISFCQLECVFIVAWLIALVERQGCRNDPMLAFSVWDLVGGVFISGLFSDPRLARLQLEANELVRFFARVKYVSRGTSPRAGLKSYTVQDIYPRPLSLPFYPWRVCPCTHINEVPREKQPEVTRY